MLVGIDFGATTIKGALVTTDGVVVRRGTMPTEGSKGPPGVIDDIAALIAELATGVTIDGVGIGVCGMVDRHRGIVLYTTDTLPGWRDVPLSNELEHRTGVRCVCDNDGNAAVLGEYLVGQRETISHLVTFTLGTGVGGGIVVNREVVRGAAYLAGHLGHIKVRAGGRMCACGARGCLEAYASAYAIRRTMHQEPVEVFAAAERGDVVAKKAVSEMADALGRAFGSLSCILNPECIVICGGISKGWHLLEAEALASFAKYALPGAASTPVVVSALGENTGVVGAAMLCLEASQFPNDPADISRNK